MNKIFLVMFLLTSMTSTVVAQAADNAGDKVVEAIADLLKEQLNEIVSLRVNSDIRESLCGYYIWDDSTKNTNKQLFSYFPKTCELVQYSIAENLLLNPSFLDAVKKDILNASVDMLNRKLYKFEDVTIEDLNAKWGNNSFLREIYLSRKKLSLTKKVLYYYFENRESSDKSNKAIITEIKTNVLTAEINTIISSNDSKSFDSIYNLILAVSYYEIHKYKDEYTLYAVNLDFSKYKEKIKELTEDSLNYYSRIQESMDNRELNWLFLSLFENIKENIKDDYRINSSSIRTLKTFAMIHDNPDKEEIKDLLRIYLADINSRPVSFFERRNSFGALVGYSYNKYRDVDESLGEDVNGSTIFVPFGLLSTSGVFGSLPEFHVLWDLPLPMPNVMFHFLDLGQYFTSDNTDTEVSWRDAVAPGVTWIVARQRRYPIAYGLDYTHIPQNDNNQTADNILRVFMSVEVPMFYLN